MGGQLGRCPRRNSLGGISSRFQAVAEASWKTLGLGCLDCLGYGWGAPRAQAVLGVQGGWCRSSGALEKFEFNTVEHFLQRRAQ